MKRIGHLHEKLLDKTYIKQTVEKASKHKTKRKLVKKVLANIDYYVDMIHTMISKNEIVLEKTHTKVIVERGKTRTITISPFYPNQILDYLVVEILKPIIKKSMYEYCIGNVDKRGIMFGKKIMERKIKTYKYFMKLDIRHFYQNVKPKLLLKQLETKIKDKQFISFVEQVIDKNELPIGCYYSQWLSNFYLCSFDHFIKEQTKIPFYIRYVDDMVFSGNNKKELKKTYYQAKRRLEQLGLEFKYLPTIKSTTNFLGFVFAENDTKLRHSIFYKLQKTTKKFQKHVCFSMIKRIISYFSWLKNMRRGYNYYSNNIKPIIKLGTIKKCISKGELVYV